MKWVWSQASAHLVQWMLMKVYPWQTTCDYLWINMFASKCHLMQHCKGSRNNYIILSIDIIFSYMHLHWYIHLRNTVYISSLILFQCLHQNATWCNSKGDGFAQIPALSNYPAFDCIRIHINAYKYIQIQCFK